ncbi:hypothetical protein L228DRAFT_265537 [Xylona heveae TC161]|uniref:BHLH domain-containing protein n=1 Tax=Xylona heveae (strain CBS 132557 / TC161) TaxID=1328760 RepID=A0A165IL23_XYLHT|nr:hypothetical protein L228DRAFT_265537 [Xylona heveae TC161]KZF25052.1 hypothetical protein L228DRAFT_265537 [Xylona heveae TC161]
MNGATSQPWSVTGFDPVTSAPDEDFTNFLDFGDMQLGFQTYDGFDPGNQNAQPDAGNAMDTTADGAISQQPGDMHQMQSDHGKVQQQQPPNLDQALGEPFQNNNPQTKNMPQHSQIQDPRFSMNPIVPPTPNSMELHGAAERYFNQMDPHAQATIDQYCQMEDPMAFTPLVSPAVTPLDTQFQMPEYTIPGSYFSPLSSPALEAQNYGLSRQVYNVHRGSDASATTSPLDPNINFTGNMGTPPSSLAAQQRAAHNPRRRPSSSRNPARTVRQSPIVKAQHRRKATSSATLAPKDLKGPRESEKPEHKILNVPHKPISESSGADSVSPEPLSESLMGPPPVPGSGSRTQSLSFGPALDSAADEHNSAPSAVAPATPASLMRMPKSSNQVIGSGVIQPDFASTGTEFAPLPEPAKDNFMLPAAATSSSTVQPSLDRIDTSGSSESQRTPTLSGKRTPKLGPLSAGTSSARSSPRLDAMASPNGTMRPLAARTAAGKKRNSSSQVSPALRPRISPSIKPLLPDGASAEQSARLLASKSNYQNILEGTTLPGVSYPSNLSTNLTSKRTSHKLAEQGRRNRINNALQEIAALLPAAAAGPGSGPGSGSNPAKKSPSSGGSGAGAGAGTEASNAAAAAAAVAADAQQSSSNSKAATVELAIQYIRQLQTELANTKDRLKTAEDKLHQQNGVDASTHHSDHSNDTNPTTTQTATNDPNPLQFSSSCSISSETHTPPIKASPKLSALKGDAKASGSRSPRISSPLATQSQTQIHTSSHHHHHHHHEDDDNQSVSTPFSAASSSLSPVSLSR